MPIPDYLALRSGSPVYRPSKLTFRKTDNFPISLMHVVVGLWKKVGGKKPTQGEYAKSLHRYVMHNIISSVKCKCWCLFVSQCGTMTNADFVVYLNLSGTGSSPLATASVQDKPPRKCTLIKRRRKLGRGQNNPNSVSQQNPSIDLSELNPLRCKLSFDLCGEASSRDRFTSQALHWRLQTLRKHEYLSSGC